MMRGRAIVVDVRTPERYEEGYIKNAINLPHYDIDKMASSKLLDKNAVIILYCESGQKSKTAAKTLLKLGYTNVYDFAGLKKDWSGALVTDW